MNKIWKYKFYNFETGQLDYGKEFKEPCLFQELQPDLDYEEETDILKIQEFHTKLYVKRRQDALDYSDAMNARIISNVIPELTSEQNEEINGQIDDLFKKTEESLTRGRWKSALREINKVDEIEGIVSQALIDEIKLYIETYIQQNY